MTTTVTVATSDHAVKVIGHDKSGANILERKVEPNSQDIFYAHKALSISITEVHEDAAEPKPAAA